MSKHRSLFVLLALAVLPMAACKRNQAAARDERPVPDAGFAREIPIPAEEITRVINPSGLPAYAGPVGAIEGEVYVDGDEPESVSVAAPCPEAEAVYGKRFRQTLVGGKRLLADAIVGVTGYKEFLPQREAAVQVSIEGCVLDKRTIVLTFGQRLDIVNKNAPSPQNFYTLSFERDRPSLVLMATPSGDAARVYPTKPGRDLLADKWSHPYLRADVFVLPSSLFVVTDRAGHFQMPYVPVGKQTISTTHPSFADGSDDSKQVEVLEGKTTHVELHLKYKSIAPAMTPAPATPKK